MKTFLTICFCMMLPGLCAAQSNRNLTVDEKVTSKIQELRNKKVDTILCSYVKCNGYISVYRPDTCVSAMPKYILWIKNGSAFIQRLDECLDYPTITIVPHFLNLLKDHLSEIKNARLSYKIAGKGKDKLELVVDHSCITVFEIHLGDKLVTNSVDEFALEKRESSESPNTNYLINKKSAINKLKNIIEGDIKTYNNIIKATKAPI